MAPRTRIKDQAGSVIVIAMMFTFVFLVLGVSLFWLLGADRRSTEMERTELKSFNVAEAGIDAGMLALKLNWPSVSTDSVTVDAAALKAALQTGTDGLWDPTRQDPSEFLQVGLYDNAATVGGAADSVPHPTTAPPWDSNGDGRMFVDSTANVGDDRHRILTQVEKETWSFNFPPVALFADKAGGNSKGLRVTHYYGGPASVLLHSGMILNGVTVGPGLTLNPYDANTFDTLITPAILSGLKTVATRGGTHFTNATAAKTYLASSSSPGHVVYIQSSSAISFSGNTQIGTREKPVCVVIDTPAGTNSSWSMSGTVDFFGLLIVRGNVALAGTASMYGALFAQEVVSAGVGAYYEINYDSRVLDVSSNQFLVGVNLVNNTWEEFTTAR